MKIEFLPPSADFAETIYRWRQGANTVKYNPLLPITLEQLRERLGKSCSDFSDLKSAAEYFLVAKVDGKICGTVSLKGINHMMMYGEIGYTIGEEFQGKGIGTAVVRSFVAKIFSETQLRRLIAHVAVGNIASRKLLLRIGFEEEGILRQHFIINGVPTDEVVYGILR